MEDPSCPPPQGVGGGEVPPVIPGRAAKKRKEACQREKLICGIQSSGPFSSVFVPSLVVKHLALSRSLRYPIDVE